MSEQRVSVTDGFAYGVIGADLHVLGSGVPLYLLTAWRRPPSPPDAWLRELPSRLLNARHGVVPFTGRRAELDDLRRWRTGGDRLAVRWLHGSGGQGKTRLADEIAARAADDGWLVVTVSHGPGQVHPPPGSQDLRADSGLGVLLIVDYADRWPLSHLALLMENRLLHSPRSARVLFVGRTDAAFSGLLAAVGETRIAVSTQRLPPLDAAGAARKEMFEAARDEFLDRYGVAPRVLTPELDPPAVLADPKMGLTLAVHMAALAAVDAYCHGRRPPRDLAGLTVYLLDREHLHWADRYSAASRATPPALLNRAVFIASLSGSLPGDAAVALLQRLLPDGSDAEHIAVDHADCYPPDIEGTLCRPLYPDRLAEDFVALTLTGHHTDYPPSVWAGSVLTGLLARKPDGSAPPWLSHAMSTLAASHLRWPHVGQQHLYPLLRADPRLAVDAGGDSLTTLTAADDVDLALLEAIEPHLPAHRHLDLDIAALAVLRRLASERLAAAPNATARADVHGDLGYRLNITGHREEARIEMERAVELYRTVVDSNGDRADLAHALANLAHSQRDVGHRSPALNSVREALELYQRLATEDPNEYEPDLAYTHKSLGTVLAALGRHEDAVAACATSADIYRRLAQKDPATYEGELAGALGNRGIWLHSLGEYQQALAVIHEAREIYQRLADRAPDAYLHEVAAVLANEGMQLDGLRRYAEAVEVMSESVDAFRTLSRTRPESFEHFLATALSNLSQPLSKLDRGAEALAVSAESVAIRRRLAEARPVVFEPDLATGLNNHAVDLLAAGQPEAALAAVSEAVQIRDRLAGADPATYEPFLASALNNQGQILLALGRHTASADAYARATDIYHRLSADRPAAHREHLVASLNGYAQTLLRVDCPTEALGAAQEATKWCRELVAVDDAFGYDLANCLTTMATALAALERVGQAREVVNEALARYDALPDDVRERPRVSAELTAARALQDSLAI